MENTFRPTRAKIDLGALAKNLQTARRFAGGTAQCAVVKANAYGHGSVPVARALEGAGAEWLGVALVEEGIELRKAQIKTPILLLFGPNQTSQGLQAAIEHDLTPVLWDITQLEAFGNILGERRGRFHLHLDTGLNRMGAMPSELDGLLDALDKMPHLEMSGVMTHFAHADLGEPDYTQRQVDIYLECMCRIEGRHHKPRWRHITNSAAILTWPQIHQNLHRPGLLLYGLDPLPADSSSFGTHGLVPVMSLVSKALRVATIPKGGRVSYGGIWTAQRESKIATLPVGYADGYRRCFGNRASVLVRGRRIPVVGRVCMDLTMIDVTDIEGFGLEEEVMLMGSQGDETVDAYELAELADTIPYEIVCGVAARISREYVTS